MCVCVSVQTAENSEASLKWLQRISSRDVHTDLFIEMVISYKNVCRLLLVVVDVIVVVVTPLRFRVYRLIELEKENTHAKT